MYSNKAMARFPSSTTSVSWSRGDPFSSFLGEKRYVWAVLTKAPAYEKKKKHHLDDRMGLEQTKIIESPLHFYCMTHLFTLPFLVLLLCDALKGTEYIFKLFEGVAHRNEGSKQRERLPDRIKAH
jgi:hypothetical protein